MIDVKATVNKVFATGEFKDKGTGKWYQGEVEISFLGKPLANLKPICEAHSNAHAERIFMQKAMEGLKVTIKKTYRKKK